MKKISLMLFISLIIFSCGKKAAPAEGTAESKNEKSAPTVGADLDSHDCKTSAGYKWSALKKECVRIFEMGTKLVRAEEGTEYTNASYVIFEGDKAELFLDTYKESIILERKSEGEPWIKDDFQLIASKGYVLKKGDVIIYTGE